MITVNDNLTVDIVSEDGKQFIKLPNYNTETVVPFALAEEAQAFAEYFLVTYPNAWSKVPTQEEIDATNIANNTAKASEGLKATDWVENASVRNTEVVPHLSNVAEFDAYRLALRSIIVNKVADVEDFPTCPEEIWVTEAQ